MKKNTGNERTIIVLLVLLVIFTIGGIVMNYILLSSVPTLEVTGRVTDSVSSVTLTQAGAAGLTLTDSAVAYGSGYFNATCTGAWGYSTLDSNLTYGNGTGSVYGAISPYCWVNTTAILTARDAHVIQNNGSVKVNLSATSSNANPEAETLFCGGSGCPFTSVAAVKMLSYNNEVGSCATGLTSGYENLLTASANATVGLCDALDFMDSNDTIEVYFNLTVPRDAIATAKTLTVVYEGLAT